MAYNRLPNPYALHAELEALAKSKINLEREFAHLLSACLNLEADKRPDIRTLRYVSSSLMRFA